MFDTGFLTRRFTSGDREQLVIQDFSNVDQAELQKTFTILDTLHYRHESINA